jgi:hypothetical protein
VFCWGLDPLHEPGTGAPGADGQAESAPIGTPARIPGIEAALAVSIHGAGVDAPDAQTCALLADMSVTCWWRGGRAPVPGLSEVAALGGNCASLHDGSVLCWQPGGAPTSLPELALAASAR